MLNKTFILAITFLLLFTSCVSVRETIESGNFDRAIDIAVSKLKGKKNKKEEYVRGLELAFIKANTRDLNTIDNLTAENNPRHWEHINDLYKNIQKRQSKIYPLLPLVSKNGHRAEFNFVDAAVLERDSRQKAADYAYNSALELLKKGENGDRVAARKAYSEFKRLKNQDVIFTDINQSILKAQEFGTTHIFVEMRNQSNVVLPRDFEYRMMNLSQNDLQSEWLSYHFDINNQQRFDYKVVVKLNNIDVSPERIATKEYVEEQKVEDGWEYSLDRKGNVLKDSLGNDVKKKRFSLVRANVLESYQTKAAKVGGDIEVYDFNNKSLLDKDRIVTEVVFENYASTFNGDRRALSAQTTRRIGNRILPFPSNLNMLNDAADRLKPILRDRLKLSKMII
jgi:hypothetical protein